MVKKKTGKQIQAAILRLNRLKSECPEYDAFGDRNWQEYDVKIAVLSGNKTHSYYYQKMMDAEDGNDEKLIADERFASDALDWLGSKITDNFFFGD